jgi:hypothetical protein
MDESQLLTILERIEQHLAARGTPKDVQQAIEDVFNTYGQIAQMREVIGQLVAIVRQHDAESTHEREQIRMLLVQLRELARKQVAGLADVERAVAGEREQWSGEERRGSGDRRKVG